MTSLDQPKVRDLMPDGNPRPNLPLLRKILDHIDAHPEEWQQDTYRSDCGTAHCVAGHAVAMTEGIQPLDCGDGYVVFRPASGDTYSVAACRALGITRFEGGDGRYGLFRSANTRADVQRHAEAIAARAGEVRGFECLTSIASLPRGCDTQLIT